MNDTIIFGQYIHKNSWIHRLDPRTKLLSLFILMVSTFLISNVYVLLGLLAFNIIIVITSKISLLKFIQSFKMIAMLIIFSTLFQIIFNRSGDILQINGQDLNAFFTLTWLNLALGIAILVFNIVLNKWFKKFGLLRILIVLFLVFYLQTINLGNITLATYTIGLYSTGVMVASMVILRIINLLMFSGILTFTTKPTDMNSGIEGIFNPFKFMRRFASILGMMISIAIRFIPTLLLEARKVLKAQAARGVDFKEGNIKEAVTQIVSLLVPMFIIAIKKSEDLANAMDARGYIPGDPRSRINELHYKVSDIFVQSFSIIIFISIVVLKTQGLV
ncbi:MAG: CbiQ family ECF transporter T component [Bacilli bacterium]